MQKIDKVDYFATFPAANVAAKTQSESIPLVARNDFTAISLCFTVLFACSLACSFAMSLTVPIQNDIASPLRSYVVDISSRNSSAASTNSSFPSSTSNDSALCTTWRYDGGFWPSSQWPSVVGHCFCSRGHGCYCFIQGCGNYESYNYWYSVTLWLNFFSLAFTILGTVCSFALFLTIKCGRSSESNAA